MTTAPALDALKEVPRFLCKRGARLIVLQPRVLVFRVLWIRFCVESSRGLFGCKVQSLQLKLRCFVVCLP